jgi:hypothetical protein
MVAAVRGRKRPERPKNFVPPANNWNKSTLCRHNSWEHKLFTTELKVSLDFTGLQPESGGWLVVTRMMVPADWFGSSSSSSRLPPPSTPPPPDHRLAHLARRAAAEWLPRLDQWHGCRHFQVPANERKL